MRQGGPQRARRQADGDQPGRMRPDKWTGAAGRRFHTMETNLPQISRKSPAPPAAHPHRAACARRSGHPCVARGDRTAPGGGIHEQMHQIRFPRLAERIQQAAGFRIQRAVGFRVLPCGVESLENHQNVLLLLPVCPGSVCAPAVYPLLSPSFWVGPSALMIVSLRAPSPVGWAGIMPGHWPSGMPSHFPSFRFIF